MATSQNQIDTSNSEFWDELCGSWLAKSLGIQDRSIESLKRFDSWYMEFYPYLASNKHIAYDEFKGRDVLEIGLGYGTVAQRLAESGASYTGLDIAAGPVEMVNHRLRQNGLAGSARQGSILAAPFADANFDEIVAIGCLHHTGDLAKAIKECRRLLRPGGRLTFMVYYAYSYRRWYTEPRETSGYLAQELRGYRGPVAAVAPDERAAYDSNLSGQAAPHTDWISVRSLQSLCADFSSYRATLENIDSEPPFRRWSRERLLKTSIPAWAGIDLYATCRA